MDRLVATLEAFLDERKQHAIFFFVAVEKRADMPYFSELRAGKRNAALWSSSRCSPLVGVTAATRPNADVVREDFFSVAASGNLRE